jgi:hypothetical protein
MAIEKNTAIKERIKTAELCLEAVKEHGWALPDKFKTIELCLEAAKQNVGTLEHVPNELMIAEFFVDACITMAVRSNMSH